MLEKTFYELIRVALGKQTCLSHTPKIKEWASLYEMAKKQSLVGVCFAGVQRLQAQRQAPNSWGSTEGEVLYLQWMGMAAKIQQRNEVVNRQCVEVQKMLASGGFKSSILKGQGVGALYRVSEIQDPEIQVSGFQKVSDLSLLRQSGDIDVWVDGGMQKALAWCQEKYGAVEYDYINAHVPCYKDTEVEVHWRAQAMTNLVVNRKLQRWLEREDVKAMMLGGKARLSDGSEIVVPSAEFNAFYILLHCYHHMFESGLGLRQLSDYYFVLNNANFHKLSTNLSINSLFEEFGMMRFAKGVMWIMGHVFGLEREYMLCEPDEEEGRFLLGEVMQNGNFGHHDKRIVRIGDGKLTYMWTYLQHNWHLASRYPSQLFWSPVWLAYHWVWKRFIKK